MIKTENPYRPGAGVMPMYLAGREKDIEEMATNYGISKEELVDAFGGKDVLAYDSKMRKTLKFLEENN